MKKILSITLLLGLLLTLFGCAVGNPSDPVSTTSAALENPDNTVNATRPVAEEVNPNPNGGGTWEWQPGEKSKERAAAVAEYGFEPWNSGYTLFRYCGTDSSILLPEGGVTLNLPEGWLDRVVVSRKSTEGTGHWFVYVTNKSVLDVFINTHDGEDYGIGHEHYIFCITGSNKQSVSEREDAGRVYLGEDENYYYYLTLPEMWEPDCNDALLWRSDLIDILGEEAYWEMVNDLAVTEDMARQMIVINDPTE